jgi:hypothetical protein
MNNWQVICPVVALLIAGLVVGAIALRGQHRGFMNVASRAIGSDLITSTNSPHSVRVGPGLQAHLAELLAARTHVAGVLVGDDPAPIGDDTAWTRLVLTNDAGASLLIRLRPSKDSGKFDVLGFRSATNKR